MDGHRALATALTESRLQADSPSLRPVTCVYRRASAQRDTAVTHNRRRSAKGTGRRQTNRASLSVTVATGPQLPRVARYGAGRYALGPTFRSPRWVVATASRRVADDARGVASPHARSAERDALCSEPMSSGTLKMCCGWSSSPGWSLSRRGLYWQSSPGGFPLERRKTLRPFFPLAPLRPVGSDATHEYRAEPGLRSSSR